MGRLARVVGLAAFAVLVGCALAAARPASPPVPQAPFYHPRLFVLPAELQEGPISVQGISEIGFERDLDATAKLVLLAPEGTTIELGQAAGTIVGTPGVRIDTDGTTLAYEPRAGTIVAADPAAYATDPQAQACAPGPHSAVWLLHARPTKNYGTGPPPNLPITLPIYLDRITPSRANMFSSFELQVCFGSPVSTQSTPGWPSAAIIRRLTLNLSQGVVAERPASPGAYTWRGIFTSYAGSGIPAPSSAVESRAVLLLPVKLLLHGTDNPARKTIAVAGTLTQGGVPVAGDAVVVWYGTALGAGWSGIVSAKRAVARTTRQGRILASIPATRTTYIRASLSTLTMAYVDSTGCTPPALAPGGCVTATQAGFTIMSPLVKVAVH